MVDLCVVKRESDKNFESQEPWEIENRYVIVEKESGKIIEDAQGYGYRSFESAKKAMWYKFGGGKQKIDNEKSEATKFWKENPLIKSFVDDFYSYGFKEIARGELSDDDLVNGVKEKFNVVLDKKYIKYI